MCAVALHGGVGQAREGGGVCIKERHLPKCGCYRELFRVFGIEVNEEMNGVVATLADGLWNGKCAGDECFAIGLLGEWKCSNRMHILVEHRF